MLSFRITDSDTWVTMAGVRNVHVSDINDTLSTLDGYAKGAKYQLFDADLVAGSNHIYHAAVNAEYALKNELNISNNLSIETLLYASCNSQINKAIKTLGVSKNSKNVAVVVFSEKESDPMTETLVSKLGISDDSLLDMTQIKYRKLLALFDITENAIKSTGKEPFQALTSLITEKGALLSLRR